MPDFTANELGTIMSAAARGYSVAGLEIKWTKGDIQAEINPYNTYLDGEQVTAKAAFSVPFQAKATNEDLRFLDIIVRSARLIKTSPNRDQYMTALRRFLNELSGV